ncbi:MAG: phosphatase domain-containing protein, partial [Owenweeksia sp.]
MISSPPEWSSYKEAPISGNWFKRWIKSRFRFVDYPFLLAYRGYGNKDEMLIQGHVFRGMALHRPRRRYSAWKNFVALIKMFMVRTIPDAAVQLECQGKFYTAQTNPNGFFEFRVENPQLEKGWHSFELKLIDELVEGQEEVQVQSEILIEYEFEFGLISDIDDTFLVSHVTKFARKLYVLLTKNAETRKPVKGVVEFYRKLSTGVEEPTNPFFYVSSSEWNLYDFL